MSENSNTKANMQPVQNPFHMEGGLQRDVQFYSRVFKITPYQDNHIPGRQDREDTPKNVEEVDGEEINRDDLEEVELSDHQKYVKLINKILQNGDQYEIVEAMGGVKTWGTSEGDLLVHVQYVKYVQDEDSGDADHINW